MRFSGYQAETVAYSNVDVLRIRVSALLFEKPGAPKVCLGVGKRIDLTRGRYLTALRRRVVSMVPDYGRADVRICRIFLYPSLLHFQRAMKVRRRRDNIETLFGVSEIPCDNKIRELTGGIEPKALLGIFKDNLRTVEGAG
jgi:hypothetical protein